MRELQNSIYWGETQHCRFLPMRHVFRYPIFFLCLELSTLSALNSWMLSYNRRALLTLRDKDYLRNRTGPIKQKFIDLLKHSDIPTVPDRTYLLTLPRCFGYVFNPVNFFISIDSKNNFHSLVAEVSNTFGEVHTYVLPGMSAESEQSEFQFRFPKQFYVSPFLDVSGFYEITLKVLPADIVINISLEQDGHKVLGASMQGRQRTLTDTALLISLLSFPLACIGTMMRIQWQAFRLVLFRRAHIFSKPQALHPSTFRYHISWIFRGRAWVLQVLKMLKENTNRRDGNYDPIT